MSSGITVAIPHIPIRHDLLGRALASVYAQTLSADAVVVATDNDREGVWKTRQRALDMVRTEFVSNLDDDDSLMPPHLERLLACLREHDADFVFSWFESAPDPGFDPLGYFGKPFDPADPHLTTSTILVKTDLAQEVGYDHPPEEGWAVAQDDWLFVLGCVKAGAKIVHLPERTWCWWVGDHVHTSGRPEHW